MYRTKQRCGTGIGTGNGTEGTATFCLSGTGTVNKMESQKLTKFLGSNAVSINIKKARYFTNFC
jgi:hypothetical protein